MAYFLSSVNGFRVCQNCRGLVSLRRSRQVSFNSRGYAHELRAVQRADGRVQVRYLRSRVRGARSSPRVRGGSLPAEMPEVQRGGVEVRLRDAVTHEIAMIAILHNIRSQHNAGSMFRSSDAAGVQKIYLTGYSPAPTDQLGKKRPQFVKVSLGAEDYVPWEKTKDVARLLKKLRNDGYKIYA